LGPWSGGAPEPYPPADRRSAAAASHLDRLSGLVSRPRPERPDHLRQLRPDLADKLSRDCRRVVASDWYRRISSTRLSPQRQAVPEFETTTQGSRTATSIGKVLTGRGAFSQARAFRPMSVRRNPRRRGDLALRFVGDSPLEEAVRSELVSETQFPC